MLAPIVDESENPFNRTFYIMGTVFLCLNFGFNYGGAYLLAYWNDQDLHMPVSFANLNDLGEQTIASTIILGSVTCGIILTLVTNKNMKKQIFRGNLRTVSETVWQKKYAVWPVTWLCRTNPWLRCIQVAGMLCLFWGLPIMMALFFTCGFLHPDASYADPWVGRTCSVSLTTAIEIKVTYLMSTVVIIFLANFLVVVESSVYEEQGRLSHINVEDSKKNPLLYQQN